MESRSIYMLMCWQMASKVLSALRLGVQCYVRFSPLEFFTSLGEERLAVSFGMLTAWNDPVTSAKEIYGRLRHKPVGEKEWLQITSDRGFPDGFVPYL